MRARPAVVTSFLPFSVMGLPASAATLSSSEPNRRWVGGGAPWCCQANADHLAMMRLTSDGV